MICLQNPGNMLVDHSQVMATAVEPLVEAGPYSTGLQLTNHSTALYVKLSPPQNWYVEILNPGPSECN